MAPPTNHPSYHHPIPPPPSPYTMAYPPAYYPPNYASPYQSSMARSASASSLNNNNSSVRLTATSTVKFAYFMCKNGFFQNVKRARSSKIIIITLFLFNFSFVQSSLYESPGASLSDAHVRISLIDWIWMWGKILKKMVFVWGNWEIELCLYFF